VVSCNRPSFPAIPASFPTRSSRWACCCASRANSPIHNLSSILAGPEQHASGHNLPRDHPMSKDNLIIFDTTMRDGEQSPGASMTRDEKLRIARALERMRVDVIEAG